MTTWVVNCQLTFGTSYVLHFSGKLLVNSRVFFWLPGILVGFSLADLISCYAWAKDITTSLNHLMKRVMLWRKLLMIGSTHLGHCLIDLEQKLICDFAWLGFLQCPSCAHVFSNASHGLLDRGERTILKWSSRTTPTFILSIVDVSDENEVHVDLLNEF